MEKIKLLKYFHFFENLDDKSLDDIASNIQTEFFPAQKIIFKQGEHGEKIYFILEGKLEAYVINKYGQDVTVGMLSKGDYFGEQALLTGGVRSCYIRTSVPSKLFYLTKSDFNKLCSVHISISNFINKILSKRLSETLYLVSERKKNIFILIAYNENTSDLSDHFENYLEKISDKHMLILQDPCSPEDFLKKSNEVTDHYVLIKSKEKIEPFFLDKADHVINFLDKTPSEFGLSSSTSKLKIERAIRKITHKTVGIALCSGGMPGVAHLSVLKVLQEENIPLDYITGSSAGALYGGSYAFGSSAERTIKLVINMHKKSHLSILARYFSYGFSGILSQKFLIDFIYTIIGDKNIEDADIPFSAIASDLYTGKTVALNKGNAVEAIMASSAAPVIMVPFRKEDFLLIDGVATNPLPVQVLIDEEIDIKIAVPIPQLDLTVKLKKNPKISAIYMRSRSLMAEQMTNLSLNLADVIISPDVKGIGMLDSRNLEKVLQEGEIAARRAVKRIRYFLEKK